ncbi:hypothetical protein AYJ54_16310 [Bradyrhizobium centrolobii]|uniref:Uncharacterized protein n=1 Tax=Bradyrhizobium centrolobii TaxID=1505087 RepID=A0A176YMS9_9BRAD|nr:hypothetical protein AYJ54_16310 [Bradyrhizobium centrolobii]
MTEEVRLLRARCHRYRLGADAFDLLRDLVANRVDPGIVADVELPTRRLVEEMAEARDPVLAGKGRPAQHRFPDSRPREAPDLLGAADFSIRKSAG